MIPPAIPRPEYPRPALRRRRWVNLNGEWEFGTGEEPRFERRIRVPFCPESELSGIGEWVGDVVWYRRFFDSPPAESLLLHFGAVDYRATVWVNGREMARHEGGHVPFSADIGAAVREGANELVVRAEDPLADKTIPRGKQHWTPRGEGIFYTPTTGIWQTVWVEPLPARRIRALRLRPDLESGTIPFELETDADADLVVRLDGEVVATWRGRSGSGVLRPSRVVPWHPERPRLYEVEAAAGEDRVSSYCGLRSVATSGGLLLLNGEPFVQRLVLDQGYFPGGLLTAASDADLRRDIELAKALGFNGARKHQKVEDPRWLHWADHLGFLVWSEAPSFHEHSVEAEQRLAAEWVQVLRRDSGHPSVVAWVVGNESFGFQGVDPAARSGYLDGLAELSRQLDGTRPVITNDGWEHAGSDLCTIHDYARPEILATRYRSLDGALGAAPEGHAIFAPGQAYKGQPVLVSEFGGLRIEGSGGWGWIDVEDAAAFARAYGELLEALLDTGPVEGFCYTQLADVEQERNGLLSADRTPKVAPPLIRAATRLQKRRG